MLVEDLAVRHLLGFTDITLLKMLIIGESTSQHYKVIKDYLYPLKDIYLAQLVLTTKQGNSPMDLG